MSVPEQVPYKEYRATGSNNSFEITFYLPDPKDLVVMVNKEIPLVGAYSIVGDSVVFSTPPNEGDLVELTRDTQLDRETNFKSYDNSFRPETINFDLDKIWLVLQESNLVDAKILARLKQEIEWRRTHDFNYDELAQVREKQLFDALKGYTDTLNAATNPGVFQGVVAGVVFARDGKSIQTHLEEILENLVASREDIDSKADLQYVDGQLDLKANQQTTYTKSEVDSVVAPLTGGHKGYTTLALAQAAQGTLPANSIVEVTNDPTSSNNGTYQWDGTTLTKSAYDPLTQAKNYADTAVINSNEYIYSTTDIFNIAYNRIAGASANTTLNESTILAAGVGREYIKIDVAEFKSLSVSNAIVQSQWVWVFVDKHNVKTVSSFFGNGTLVIPETAVSAYRTVRVDSAGLNENANMLISAETKKMPLQAQIITLNNKLVSDFDELQASLEDIQTGEAGGLIPIEPITGGSVVTESSNPNLLAMSSQRKYLKLNVEKYSQLVISGARTNIPQWVWVFTDENLNRLAISSFFGNGELAVPENAAWALRTYEVGESAIYELETLQISATKKSKSIAVIYDELKNDVSRLEQSSSSNSGFYGLKATMMQEAFQRGEMLKISDFNEVNQHDQIESAIRFIKKRGWGILDMGSGVWLRNSAVLLPDNCWIYLNEATVKLADGVFDNVFRNDGIVPNPDPFEYALELNENRNIRIFGKSKDLAKVSGPDIPYTAPHPINGGDPVAWVGDWYGWRTLPILLANVKDYKLHDFSMEKTTCWAVSQENGCDNFEVYNIEVQSTVKNGDGVDVRQGCKKGKIYNITGNTSDDMVALSAIQNFVTQHPSGNYIYPLQVGGYDDRGFGGDIEDIQISNIAGRGQHNGVRLLASGGSKLKNISVDDVTDVVGAFHASMVLVSSGYGAAAQMGDMINITVNGIESNFSQTPLTVSGPIKDSSFNKIRQHKQTGVLYTNTATFENTEITNAEFVV